MQAAFVEHVVSGHSPNRAAELAGYSEHATVSYRIMKLPAVQAAIFEGVQRSLRGDAAVNLRVLRKIRDDDNAPARVRADIGLKLMQLAGHVAPSTQEGKAQKALSDMTRDEMIAFIESNQAAIERAEQELMSRAKDVSPGASVTVSVPEQSAAASNELDYLD